MGPDPGGPFMGDMDATQAAHLACAGAYAATIVIFFFFSSPLPGGDPRHLKSLGMYMESMGRAIYELVESRKEWIDSQIQ